MSTSTLSIPVPVSGMGSSVDVSSLAGPKTVVLTGTFRGIYVLYGSHFGGNLAPLFQFDAGGVEGIRRTFSGALARVAIESLATGASGVTASISGFDSPGNNSFSFLGILGPGARGPQPSLDLGTTNYQADLNFIVRGGLRGKLVVEGSLDDVRWNPIGQFSVGSVPLSLLGEESAEFSPLATEDLVRYVRLNVLGEIVGSLVVTVGGSKSGGGGGVPSETLAEAYQAGSSGSDQTLVLSDVRGGGLVLDASGTGFTFSYALQVVVPATSAGNLALVVVRSSGQLLLGPDNIVVGTPTALAQCISAGTLGHVVIGAGALSQISYGYGGTVVVGRAALAYTDPSVVIGDAALLDYIGYGGTVVGPHAHGLGYAAIAVGQGATAIGGPNYDSPLAVGNSAASLADHTVSVGTSASATFPFAIAVGAYTLAAHDYSVAVGAGAVTTKVNQLVVGDSGGTVPGTYAIHEVIVRGYDSGAGAAIDTLVVVDDPVDGSTGLTVVRNSGGTLSNVTMKIAQLGTLGPTALVATF